MADKKIIAELEVQTGRSKQNLHEVTEELSGQGDAAVKNAGRITAALDGVENATARIIRKEEEGGVVTERDGKAAIQNYERLKVAITEAFGSLENAPEKTKAAFSTATAQYELATKKIRENTDSVQDNSQALKEGGGRFEGIGETINKALGPLGKYQVGLIGVAAAFKEGWQLGTQFAEAIGTNFSALESATANLKRGISSLTSALVTDGPIEAMKQWAAVQAHFTDSVVAGGRELAGFNALVQAGVDRVTALKVSDDDLKKVVDAYSEAQKGGAAGLKLFNETVTASDPSTLGKRLDDLTPRFKELALQEQLARDKQRELTEAQTASIGVIDGVIKKLREEIQARHDGTDAAEQQIDKYRILHDELKKNADVQAEQEENLGGVTLSMRALLVELDKLLPTYQQNTARVKNATDALKQLLETNESLTPEEKDRIKRLEEQLENYDNLTPAQRLFIEQMIQEILHTTEAKAAAAAHAAGLDDLAGKTNAAKGATVEATGSLKEHTAAIKNATAETDTHGVTLVKTKLLIENVGDANKHAKGTFTDFGESVKKAGPPLIDYNTLLDKLDQHLKDVAQHAKEAAEAIDKLGSSATAAAGSGGSKSPPPSTSPEVPGDPLGSADGSPF